MKILGRSLGILMNGLIVKSLKSGIQEKRNEEVRNMKKYLAVAVLSFILGCFWSSPKVVIDIVRGADSIKSNIETGMTKLEDEIKSLSETYKVEASKQAKVYENTQVMQAGFACTPEKPKPKEEPKPEVVKPVEPAKPTPAPQVVAPAAVKPRIVSVKAEQNLVAGRMMITKMNIKLNKEALDKVKKGAKVRIFIDYCYYESDKIESDGTVGIYIGWHPPLKPVNGKVGVSLFMQTNNPEIGSGVQYTSIIIST
jgi:hypothetical protein